MNSQKKPLGSSVVGLSSISLGVTGNRADHFLFHFPIDVWQQASDAEAQSCELEGSVIIPQGQWLFWGTGTHCGAPYSLVLVLHLHTLRGFWRTSWLISSLHFKPQVYTGYWVVLSGKDCMCLDLIPPLARADTKTHELGTFPSRRR